MAQAPEGAIGVKLSTPRRGCSGLAYSVDYVTEAKPFDERIETPGGTFFVDGGSMLYLIGIDDGLGRGRFHRRLRLREPQRQGRLRLRRELHGLAIFTLLTHGAGRRGRPSSAGRATAL